MPLNSELRDEKLMQMAEDIASIKTKITGEGGIGERLGTLEAKLDAHIRDTNGNSRGSIFAGLDKTTVVKLGVLLASAIFAGSVGGERLIQLVQVLFGGGN